jgi:hypothetical protein
MSAEARSSRRDANKRRLRSGEVLDILALTAVPPRTHGPTRGIGVVASAGAAERHMDGELYGRRMATATSVAVVGATADVPGGPGGPCAGLRGTAPAASRQR